MKLDMTTALNKGGFLIPVCNQLHLARHKLHKNSRFL